MSWGLGLMIAAFFFIVYSLNARDANLDTRLKELENVASRKSSTRELVIRLNVLALLEHPKCRAYYAPLVERLTEDDLVLGAGKPLLRHRTFRLVFLADGLIWSDYHETVMEDFELRGNLLNAETGLLALSDEPHAWLRLDSGQLELHLVVKAGPLKNEVILLSTFPAGRLTPEASTTPPRKHIEDLVAALEGKGFKWCTWGYKDVFTNDVGQDELYEPDRGYVMFADNWMEVAYKEHQSFWWGGYSFPDKYSDLLDRLGQVTPGWDLTKKSESTEPTREE